jgi:hypothetical protein
VASCTLFICADCKIVSLSPSKSKTVILCVVCKTTGLVPLVNAVMYLFVGYLLHK